MNDKKHIHLIGICGTAMASLAGMLKQRGFHVTGSDAAAYPPMSGFLEELGIAVAQPFDARNLEPRPDLIVVGNKGMKGVRRVLGSVPNSVAHGAACSVLIVDTTD